MGQSQTKADKQKLTRKDKDCKLGTLKSGAKRPSDPTGSRSLMASTKPNLRKACELSSALIRMHGRGSKAWTTTTLDGWCCLYPIAIVWKKYNRTLTNCKKVKENPIWLKLTSTKPIKSLKSDRTGKKLTRKAIKLTRRIEIRTRVAGVAEL